VKVLLDTTVVSAIMHRLPGALQRLRRYRPGEVVLSSPVAAEITFGVERLEEGSRKRRNLDAEYRRLREAVRWRDWTEDAAVVFGRQKARLQSLGQPLDDMDLAIASVALSIGARVATHNVRHFERVDGLEVEDWSDVASRG
jgi:predicted nucleic acid-binding protein